MSEEQKRHKLEEAFLKVKSISLSASCYRMVRQEYDVLNTNGSLLYPGRYSNGTVRVLYASDSKETCEAEFVRKTKVRPKFSCKLTKLDVKVKKVIDLTNEKNLNRFDIHKSDLTGKNRDITQQIANLAYQKGFEGLLVSSVTGKGNNIILFPENFSKDSIVKKVTEEIV